MKELEEAFNQWQCTDIEEKYINCIEPVHYNKGELLSFAEFYHKSKVNNSGLDDFNQQTELFEIIADRLEEELPFELEGIKRETLIRIISSGGQLEKK